jgi:hypothetical protein
MFDNGGSHMMTAVRALLYTRPSACGQIFSRARFPLPTDVGWSTMGHMMEHYV